MENTKDKSSRPETKSRLNESSFPLLEGGEEVDLKSGCKMTMEMETKDYEEGTRAEECKGADGKDPTNDEKACKKKGKKEKKKKEKVHTRSCSFSERLTAGLNLLDRDDRNVNDHVNIVFEDVLAEPDANHGFDATWRLAFFMFSGTKLWVYRIISALLAIPCGLLWGVIFSVLTLLNVWLVSPLLRTFNVVMHVLHKLWAILIHTFMDPIFQSVGQLFSSISINKTATPQEPIKEP